MKTPFSPGFMKFGGAGDGVYVFLARTFAQVSQFTIFIVAARLLSPAEFGLFALMSGVAILLAKLGEAGWREFVLSSPNAAAVEQAMTASVISGAVTTALCFAAAAVAYAIVGSGEATWLLALFAIWLLPTGMAAVQAGMMVRRERIAALSSIQAISELTGLVVSIACLLDGAGLLSLVYGRLACQLVNVAGLSGLTRWFPPFRLERAVAWELVEFSRQILATRLISFFRSYGATFAVGSLLGPASAGYFRAAERLVVSLSEVLAETVQVLAWKSCARAVAQVADPAALRRRLAREAQFLHPVLLATAAPIFVGLALVSENLIEVVLGPQWHAAALVASIIAVRQLLLMPGFLTEPLLATAGEVRRMPPVSAFNAVLALAMVVVCAPFGIVAVALGQCFAATVSLAMSIRLQSRYAGVAFVAVALRARSILPALAMMAVAVPTFERVALDAGFPLALVLASQVASGAIAYGATLFALQGLTTHERRLLVRPAVPA